MVKFSKIIKTYTGFVIIYKILVIIDAIIKISIFSIIKFQGLVAR